MANSNKKRLETLQMNELTQKGRCQAEMDSFDAVKKRRANLVNNLKKKYDILRNQENADEILTILNRQHQAYNKDLQDFEEIVKRKENEINGKINSLKSQQFINRENQKNNRAKYSSNQAKYEEHNMKLKSNEVSQQEIAQLNKTIKEKDRKVKEEQQLFDEKDYLSQIKRKESELEETKETFRKICDEISKIHANSKLQVQYSLTKDKLKEKEEALNQVKEDYQKQMQSIYNTIYDQREIKGINNKYKMKLSNEKSNLKVEIEQIKNHIASTQTRLSIAETSYKKSLAEIEKNNERIKEVCGDNDLKELLEETERDLLEKQDMLANVSSAKIMYNKFIAKSKKSHSCPLCIKKFEDQEEEKFIERMEKIIQRIPESIEKAKVRVDEELKKRDRLRALEPLYMKVDTLKNKELIKLQEEMNKYKEEEETLGHKLTNVSHSHC